MTEATQARDAGAFKGVFSDFKLVKTRKVAQFVIEVPLENADAALAALGGLPTDEQWVGVARLNTAPVEIDDDEVKPKRDWGDVSLSQQAGMKCKDDEFIVWLANDRYGSLVCSGTELPSVVATDRVRQICGSRRRDFDTDTVAGNKWRKLYQEFTARHMTEER